MFSSLTGQYLLDPRISSSLYNLPVIVVNQPKSFLRSGELARAAGVSTDTLRHYERKGVLACPRRAPNNYRIYLPEALERVHLIRRALSVGFTLDELASILRVRDRGGAPCEQVRSLAAAKLSDVEKRLREMIALRDELRTLLQDWDVRLARRSPGERVRLLEVLASSDAYNPESSRRFRIPLNRELKRKKSQNEK